MREQLFHSGPEPQILLVVRMENFGLDQLRLGKVWERE